MNAHRPGRACRLCGQARLKLHFALDRRVYWRCRSCGLVQMFPVPEKLSGGDDYTGYDLEKQRKCVQLFFVPRYQHALRLIQAHGTGGRLLDVGCGTGEFLGEAEAAGFSVFGVEPSETAYSIARQRHAVVRGELKDISLKEGSFDVATLWSVLEHVPDPFPFLEKVRLVLKKEGLLALRVPSARGLLAVLALWLYRASAGLVRRPLEVIYQLDWHYKHFFLYDRENLGLLLGKCGFKILAVEEDAGFDLRSLDFRMDYLPRSGGARILFMAALLVILQLSSFLGRRDELVVLARKSG